VLAEELDEVPRELGRLVDLCGTWSNPLACERPDEIADLALLVRQRVVGNYSSQVKTTDSAERRAGPWYTASTLLPSGSSA
jgi:hypothetical protein